MAFLTKAKKGDLRVLADEMGLVLEPGLKILQITEQISNSPQYSEEIVKALLSNIIEDRKSKEEEEKRVLEKQKLEEERAFEQEKLEKERAFELEKLKLNLEAQKNCNENGLSNTTDEEIPKYGLKKFIPSFDPKEGDIALYLNLFERQLRLLKISETSWVSYLIGLLPADVAKLIARESEEDAKSYKHVKTLLLKRYKLSAEKFRQLFATHRKSPERTFRDFYFELRDYFEGWLEELNVNTFEDLKSLIIADQMKKKTPEDFKSHFIDEWSEWNSPAELADKLDAYENLRSTLKRDIPPNKKKVFTSNCEFSRPPPSTKKNYFSSKNDKPNSSPHDDRPTLACYGCGAPGVIKSRCPKCSPNSVTRVGNVLFQSCSAKSSPIALMNITVNGFWGTACADSGASHCIAGELLYHLLKQNGVYFQKTQLTMLLADGVKNEVEAYTACVDIGLEGRVIKTKLIALPHAKENRTLLGTDFLQDAGVVLNLKNRTWFFNDCPRQKFPFAKEVSLPDNSVSKTDLNLCHLRENEGKNLTVPQRQKLNTLLESFERVFQPGGEPTPFIEHHINTGNHPPVAVPPYRMSPAKQEILKKELDELLKSGIIEECESPYAAPVVLVPKENGSVRLCIDYRKLNAVTVPDTYPLPRMDDLLQGAHHTSFMSTIDLKSGYHQVKVHSADKDKTAFVCPFGTFRFTRMPFGLRNAPATFQRLMDVFCRSLPALTYLDDIIVLSPTFEQHIQDLESVFKRLIDFKLHANRGKCHFSCSRVKYLGLWITPQGIEVDPDKVSAILGIPPPKNVKQLQSFLQTCSWFRKFIPNFSKIAQPLSNLTKKHTEWSWKEREQSAFDSLKQSLVSPPVLKQADFLQPFVIRTDASNYAIGACLLQGQGTTEERPIEYASRLLTSAERNYSTTEREALAVVWALNKFRGYIEGSSVTVASDHQPLKWLMGLKSPSGRLARWALQIQSYNLKIEYTPGKSNVVADMLSRPMCHHETLSCEICAVTINIPSRSPNEIRTEQLKDEEVAKIIRCFESEDKGVDYANWTERGFLMNQGVLYRYSPDSESEEAQLFVPSHERETVLRDHHDAPTAGHYGAEGTYERIAKRYYWTGMRKFITDYVKSCPDCNRFKASNQKPAGLLQTPVPSQRFETIAIDLFGPLPETKDGKRWVLIIEDCATKWVELFALPAATAKECAITLFEEVFLRYGLPRRIISDNGTQFVSAVMQQLCFLLNVKQSLIPVYHPQANPVERKNRDLKPRLAILVQNEHTGWSEKLPAIRFAMNTAKCQSTGQTASFLHFGRELRTIDDVSNDIRGVIENDNFVPEITPYLKRFAKFMTQVKEVIEKQQNKNKLYADRKRRPAQQFFPGDRVYVTLHPVSSAAKGRSAKFMPRRDGPYVVLTQRSPSSYEVANPQKPEEPFVYHASALTPYKDSVETPRAPLRKRGRPPKIRAGCLSGRRLNQRGRL